MSGPFVGEIRLFAGNFAPVGWAFCEGQLLPISENETLFQLIGTTYGGDGQETFALPDLRSRIPIHTGQGPGLSSRIIGEEGGVEDVTLTASQIPTHNHALIATASAALDTTPTNDVIAQPSQFDIFLQNTPTTAMAANSIGQSGGSQPHDNMQPFLCLNFIISLFGVFPSS